MTAAVLSIGTELSRGELTNTNARWIAERLTVHGFEVSEIACVPDDLEAISSTVRRLGDGARVMVITGGLGPTSDDLTSQAAAMAAGVELVRDDASLEAIRNRYAAAGRTMSPLDEKQADLPDGAVALPNQAGTAPGFALTVGSCRTFFLPGVPHEMKRLFEDQVRPQIRALVQPTTHQKRIRTFGLPESVVAEKLVGLEDEFEGITIGYRATFPELEVKVFARADTLSGAEARARAGARAVVERLGRDIAYGEDDDTYPAHVGRLLRDRNLTVALAESCTGGMVSMLMTGIPGSSDYLLMSAVTYSNASKSALVGVSGEVLRAYGAVSAECAAEMAEGARRRADADLAVSITGVAGPGGGTEEKPVGTVWIGLSRQGGTSTELYRLHGDRSRVRRMSAYCALRTLAIAAVE